MKKLALLLGGIALAVAPCTNAFADDFTFSYSSPELSASGILTGSQDPSKAAGIFLASSVEGTASIDGVSYDITGLLPINGFLGNDNDFYSNPADTIYDDGQPFDFNGFAFALDNGDFMTLYANGGVPSAIAGTDNDPFEFVSSGTVGASFTPEPGSLTLLGTGVLALAGVVRRRILA